MINVNNVNNVVKSVNSNINNSQNLKASSVDKHQGPSISTVVNLQSNLSANGEKNTIKVDSANAQKLVADITSLLKNSDGSVQSNISAFDAASLLA